MDAKRVVLDLLERSNYRHNCLIAILGARKANADPIHPVPAGWSTSEKKINVLEE